MLNCVDLFAGAGGFSLAARQAGLRVRLAVENDKHALATYRANLGQQVGVVHQGDIGVISPAELLSASFEADEHCDLLLGGPPCQGFSAHRINDAGVDDERNELILAYFEFVRTFAPRAFLLENVPGMLWPRHAGYLERFYSEANSAGYQVFAPVVLDARDYGVPQRRKRVFILGMKNGVDATQMQWPPSPSHGDERAREADPSLAPWRNCAAAFAAAPDGDPNNIHMQHSDALKGSFRRTPSDGGSRSQSGRILDCHKDHDGHKDVYGRIDRRGPAPTMTTACINPSKGRFVHPTQDHGITARQAARIQTFPDNFIFEGGLMAAGKQIGNAVPILLARILIQHIANHLEGEQAERNIVNKSPALETA